MKKSTILSGAALVFFLGTLTAFNFVLKAEYDTGHYKNPYFQFVPKKFSGFTAVEVNGASRVSVQIIQGDYQVRVHERAQEYLQIRQQGNKLLIDVAQTEGDMPSYGDHTVLISCPNLASLTTTGRYTLKGTPGIDRAFNYMVHTVKLQGLTQDSLQIRQDHATQVELEKCSLGKLVAEVGRTPGSTSVLTLGPSNQVQSAELTVNTIATLNLHNVVIPAVHYQFSDSARVILLGSSLASLNKQ
ncbi:hypothetical protein [Rufibacter psychrotolerans]|uniref:hypothetical protein n=1 Tax=Rufibacter psychrotolerans TaxID=2812556 RepID=UPI0019688AEB|nr:hypothetical protein [Rufibacter sp. SYSU D00308]